MSKLTIDRQRLKKLELNRDTIKKLEIHGIAAPPPSPNNPPNPTKR